MLAGHEPFQVGSAGWADGFTLKATPGGAGGLPTVPPPRASFSAPVACQLPRDVYPAGGSSLCDTWSRGCPSPRPADLSPGLGRTRSSEWRTLGPPSTEAVSLAGFKPEAPKQRRAIGNVRLRGTRALAGISQEPLQVQVLGPDSQRLVPRLGTGGSVGPSLRRKFRVLHESTWRCESLGVWKRNPEGEEGAGGGKKEGGGEAREVRASRTVGRQALRAGRGFPREHPPGRSVSGCVCVCV